MNVRKTESGCNVISLGLRVLIEYLTASYFVFVDKQITKSGLCSVLRLWDLQLAIKASSRGENPSLRPHNYWSSYGTFTLLGTPIQPWMGGSPTQPWTVARLRFPLWWVPPFQWLGYPSRSRDRGTSPVCTWTWDGYPSPPLGQQKEYSLRDGRYAGGLSCLCRTVHTAPGPGTGIDCGFVGRVDLDFLRFMRVCDVHLVVIGVTLQCVCVLLRNTYYPAVTGRIFIPRYSCSRQPKCRCRGQCVCMCVVCMCVHACMCVFQMNRTLCVWDGHSSFSILN